MAWVFFVVLSLVAVTAVSSLWWARRPVRSGLVLAAVMVLCALGLAKQAAWGVSEVSSDSGQWCLTYDHPDGTRFTECRPTEDEAWAWADALDAELEDEYGPREKTTTSGSAFTVLFYASFAGAIVSFGWAGLRHRRARRPESGSP